MVKNLLLILLSMPIVAVGAPVLQLNGSEPNIDLSGYLDIFIDTSKILTFDQIQSSEISNQFKTNTQNVPNFGFTKNAIWVRFNVRNNTDKALFQLLQISHPILDSIIIYQQDIQGHVEIITSGDLLPFSARDRDYRHFIFEIKLEKGVNKTFYLRIESKVNLQIPLRLLTEKSFSDQVDKQQFVYGIFYGLVLGLILYNLMLYFTISDKSYLYYVLYNTCTLAIFLYIHGLSFQLFWPDNTWLANHNLPFFMGNMSFWSLQFTRAFLNIDKLKPGQIICYQLLSVSSVLVVFSSFMPDYGLATKMAIPLMGFGTVFLVYSAVTSLLDGFRPARFYLIAFTPLYTSTIIFLLNRLGYFPTNFLTENGSMVGVALEVILLSLALSDRLNQSRIQRKMALKSQLVAAQQTARLSETFKKFVPHAFLRYLNKQSINDVELGDCVEKICRYYFLMYVLLLLFQKPRVQVKFFIS